MRSLLSRLIFYSLLSGFLLPCLLGLNECCAVTPIMFCGDKNNFFYLPTGVRGENINKRVSRTRSYCAKLMGQRKGQHFLFQLGAVNTTYSFLTFKSQLKNNHLVLHLNFFSRNAVIYLTLIS